MFKLPQLNIKRSTSNLNNVRNTKFLLQNIEEKLEEFANDVRNTRL